MAYWEHGWDWEHNTPLMGPQPVKYPYEHKLHVDYPTLRHYFEKAKDKVMELVHAIRKINGGPQPLELSLHEEVVRLEKQMDQEGEECHVMSGMIWAREHSEGKPDFVLDSWKELTFKLAHPMVQEDVLKWGSRGIMCLKCTMEADKLAQDAYMSS